MGGKGVDGKELARALWLLRLEYAEIEALRVAADELRGLRERFVFVDTRFD